MRQYYVQTLCYYRDSFGKVKNSFIEEGLLVQHEDYLVYRDLAHNHPEVYTSMQDFKSSFCSDVKDFNKYCKLLELK